MRIDFNRTLIDFTGRKILDKDGSTLTLRKAASFALVAVLPGDERASLEDKLVRETLAADIWRNPARETTLEEAVLVKNRVNLTFPSPLTVSAAVRLLEGKDDPQPMNEDDDGKVVAMRQQGEA